MEQERKELDEKIRIAYQKRREFKKENFKLAYPILKPYVKKDYFHEEDYNVEGVPPEIMEELIRLDILEPTAHPGNASLTMLDLIDLAKNNKGLCDGTARPQDTYFDAIVFDVPEEQAKKLKRKLKPDEFSKELGGYRFWWD